MCRHLLFAIACRTYLTTGKYGIYVRVYNLPAGK